MADNEIKYDDFPDYTLIDSSIPYCEYAPTTAKEDVQRMPPPVPPRSDEMMVPPAHFAPVQRPQMSPPPFPPQSYPPPFPPQSYPPLPSMPGPSPQPPPPSRKKWIYGIAGVVGAVLVIVAASSGLFLYL